MPKRTKQVPKIDTNIPRTFAKGTTMTVDDGAIGRATEGAVLKFVVALFELMNPGEDGTKAAVSAIGMDKGAFVQHKEGHGSIGVEGWEKLGQTFDIRAYDVWVEAKRKQYRKA